MLAVDIDIVANRILLSTKTEYKNVIAVRGVCKEISIFFHLPKPISAHVSSKFKLTLWNMHVLKDRVCWKVYMGLWIAKVCFWDTERLSSLCVSTGQCARQCRHRFKAPILTHFLQCSKTFVKCACIWEKPVVIFWQRFECSLCTLWIPEFKLCSLLLQTTKGQGFDWVWTLSGTNSKKTNEMVRMMILMVPAHLLHLLNLKCLLSS